jgi:hypothetical protein
MARETPRLVLLVVAAAAIVFGLRWTLAPPRAPGARDVLQGEGPPTLPVEDPASGAATGVGGDEAAATTAPAEVSLDGAEPDAPASPPREVVVVERRPPIVTHEEDLGTLDDASLWRLGTSGDPSVGIPRRVAALETLLTRPLTREERVDALSALGFTMRGLQVPTQTRQVETLRELIDLAGPDSEMAQRATVQMAWPLWEMGRKEEAYRLVQDLIDSPRASALYRGLAHWAAMIFAIGLDRMPQAEAHFQQLLSIRESRLVSTVQMARERIAAARREASRR